MLLTHSPVQKWKWLLSRADERKLASLESFAWFWAMKFNWIFQHFFRSLPSFPLLSNAFIDFWSYLWWHPTFFRDVFKALLFVKTEGKQKENLENNGCSSCWVTLLSVMILVEKLFETWIFWHCLRHSRCTKNVNRRQRENNVTCHRVLNLLISKWLSYSGNNHRNNLYQFFLTSCVTAANLKSRMSWCTHRPKLFSHCRLSL